MIDYKKILNYVMMYKSWVDSDKINDPMADTYDLYLMSMEIGDFMSEDEWEWIRNNNITLTTDFRENIDNIFKIMGIYKEPVLIAE